MNAINFDFGQNVQLENDRVLLRPLEERDYEHLLFYSENEPEIWKYSLMQPTGAAQLHMYLKAATAARKAQQEYPFIVFDKAQNTYAGSTRFYDIQLNNKTLQIGYTWYGSAFQRTGLNRNCKLLLLEFAFEQLDMERVEFRADNNNERSINAMKAIGCTVEGVLRSNGYKPDGSRRDSIVLSILKDEWHNSVKENLKQKIR